MTEGGSLDLADSLAGDLEAAAYLLEGLGSTAKSEPGDDDVALALAELKEQ